MMPHGVHEDLSLASRPRHHRVLPIAGGSVILVALLAHLAGGAVLVHAGLSKALASLGLGAGALVVVLVALGTIKVLLLVFLGATQRIGGTPLLTQMSQTHSDITNGKMIRGAHSYDLHVALLTLGRAGALRERTIESARIASGEAVLDVGCGTGEITMRAKVRSGPTGLVAGIDPAPEMIAVARQKAARAGLDIDYRVAAVEALPFADATFAVVVSSLMMHHLPEDLKPRALAEIRRVLKPGGRLVVIDFQPPSSRLGRLAPVWLLHRVTAADGLEKLPPLLQAAGFIAIDTRGTEVEYLGYVQARVGQ